MKKIKQFFNWFVMLFNPTTRKRIKAITKLGERREELNKELRTANGRKITSRMLQVTRWKRQGRSDNAIKKIIHSRNVSFAIANKKRMRAAYLSEIGIKKNGRTESQMRKLKRQAA